MSFNIHNRWTKAVLYHSDDAHDLTSCLRLAIASGADLGGANLRGADLGDANLERADLERANLGGANLGGANGLLRSGIMPLQICGSQHWIIVRQPGYITIGCEHQTAEWWETNAVTTGEHNGYSDEQIAEYVAHIAYCKQWMAAKGVLNVEVHE